MHLKWEVVRTTAKHVVLNIHRHEGIIGSRGTCADRSRRWRNGLVLEAARAVQYLV
jgi:hypothetical protein